MPTYAYITVASSTVKISPGEEFTIFVPDVPVGYVDKALWSCSNPLLQFITKDDVSATVRALPQFSGSDVIELYYTEKYVTSTGHTRANTYYKKYIITATATGNNNKPKSIVISSPIEIPVGEMIDIYPAFEPAGTTAPLSCSKPTNKDIASVFLSGGSPQNLHIWALKEGATQITLSTDNNIHKNVTIKVLPPAFPGVKDENGNADTDKNLLKATQRIENLINKSLEYKNKL